MRTLLQVALAAAALVTAGSATATTFSAYMATVHLRDGKQVVCAVNEPRSMQPTGVHTLSTRERIKAQIDATARLRKHPVNKDNYPSAATAPRVNCT